MNERPHRNELTESIKRVFVLGHVMEQCGHWLYPCVGCGAEWFTPAFAVPCPNPSPDPEALLQVAQSQVALLMEIRDLLERLVEG